MRQETKHQIEQVTATVNSTGWALIKADLDAKVSYLDESWFLVSKEERDSMAIERAAIQKLFDTIDNLIHPTENE